MRRYRHKHSRKVARLGMALLACFALSVLLTPVLHAQMTGAIDFSDAGVVGAQTAAQPYHDHGHSHDDEPVNGTAGQFDGHNPMDHSHDVPAVFMISAQPHTKPDRAAVLGHTGPFVVGTIFDIDRPPRC